MELQASLQSLHITSPDPEQAARFYSGTYDMTQAPAGDGYICHAPGRTLRVSKGQASRLKYAHYGLQTDAAWKAFVEKVKGLEHQPVPDAMASHQDAIALRDPDGNIIVFTPPVADEAGGEGEGASAALPAATLQHFGMRTTNLPAMLAFYTEQLGFVLSDAVKDPEGILRACFLRTDRLHHSLALFFAPVSCFDHQSFEAPDWHSMRVWGDHMAAIKVPIVWGIGRHGPGNDVFFMVRDPDGNLAEISAEIEHCEPDRPAGQWAHEERTLNLWGMAFLRS
jgi:catechol 2,3-dioxygenase